MMFENKLQQKLNDVNYRVELYRQELIEHNVCNNETDELIELCIEANYQEIHDSLLTLNYSEYNQWINKNINMNDSYSRWVNKVKKYEDEKHLRRYQKIMKRV
jgi:uncharacterized membrane-anchored protein YhcB (DUF1043 family)